MSRGQTGLAVALVAAVVGGAGAAHASIREVMVPSLPEGYPMVVATPDGGAWLLGDEEPGYFGPRALWRIDPKGRRPRRIALPAGRQPLAIAASPVDEKLWIAGEDFVAVLERDGSLRAAAIPSHDVRSLALAATGEGRAVLSRGDEILQLGDGGTRYTV